MALMKCPECGGNVSDQAASCPHCGYSLKEHARREQFNAAKKDIRKNKPAIIVLGTLVLICVIALAAGASGLSGKDKEAYDVLEKAAVTFKDPSSVRLVSGNFFIRDLYCKISATNSYGARNTAYYEISETGHVKEADSSSVSVHERYFDDTSALILTSDEICRLSLRRAYVKRDSKRRAANLSAHEYNIEKINKALGKRFSVK